MPTSFKIRDCTPAVWIIPADLPGQSDPWFAGNPCGCRGSVPARYRPRHARNGRGTFPEPPQHASRTGLRSHRHHQHRDPGDPDQLERDETPDPVRSGAVKPRIQCVGRARPVANRVWRCVIVGAESAGRGAGGAAADDEPGFHDGYGRRQGRLVDPADGGPDGCGARLLRVLARGRQVDRGQPGGPSVAETGQRDPARNSDTRTGQDLQQPGGLLVVAGLAVRRQGRELPRLA